MSTFFEKVDVNVELPPKDWRGFALTNASGVQFKRIVSYLKNRNLWLDGDMYREEFVTHWLRENETYERNIKLKKLQRKIKNNVQKRDKIKELICEDSNIRLIKISYKYNTYKKIEEKLKNILFL